MRRITMMGYGEIFTCHLKEVTNEDGAVVGYKPDLNNRCLKAINGLVDVISVITQTWDEKGESHRWLQTRATPTITAGSRFKYLKARIPFGYQEFVKALSEAIEEEEKHGAVVVDRAEIDTTPTLDFKAIRAEASDLWQKLIDKDTENAARILKKIEITFGRKMKLSEITEDQVDLMELVVIDMRDMLAEYKD